MNCCPTVQLNYTKHPDYCRKMMDLFEPTWLRFYAIQVFFFLCLVIHCVNIFCNSSIKRKIQEHESIAYLDVI